MGEVLSGTGERRLWLDLDTHSLHLGITFSEK